MKDNMHLLVSLAEKICIYLLKICSCAKAPNFSHPSLHNIVTSPTRLDRSKLNNKWEGMKTCVKFSFP